MNEYESDLIFISLQIPVTFVRHRRQQLKLICVSNTSINSKREYPKDNSRGFAKDPNPAGRDLHKPKFPQGPQKSVPGDGLGIFTDRDQRSIFFGF